MKGQKVFRLSRQAYICAAVTAVLLVFAMLLIFSGGNDGQIALYYSPAHSAAVVIEDNELSGETIPGKGISCTRYSMDNNGAAVLMADGVSYSLYKVKSGSVKKLATDCTSEVVYSYEKDRVVYRDSKGNLYRDKTLLDDSVLSFAVSPDAASVIYVKTIDNVDKLCLYNKGKTTVVGEGFTPVAVNSDGSDIYVLTADNSFCIIAADGTMKSKLASGAAAGSIVFSEDFLSVVFSDGEYTYISVEGKSRVRLMPGIAKPVAGDKTEIRLDSAGNSVMMNSSLFDEFYGADNGDGTFSVCYVDADFARTDVSAQVKKCIVTGDKTMAYLDTQGRIYTYNGKESELAVSGAVDFQATDKNRYVYTMTSAGEVYSLKGTNNQLIAKGAYRFYMNTDNTLFIIMTDRKLYSVKGTKRSEVIAENVNSCAVKGDYFCYSADFNSDTGTYDVYYSSNGKKFRPVAEDVIKQ